MLPFGAMSVDTAVVYVLLYLSLYFEVFLLISFIAHKNTLSKTTHKTKCTYYPSTTIIVPCYNEEKTLAGTLRSLLALDYPQDKLSIVVVNDGSKDKTQQIAEEFASQYQQIKVLSKENGGKASAMNMAIAQCKTELVGCLDADSFVSPNALKLISAKFAESSDISAVTPAIMIHNPTNALQYMQRAEYMVGIFMKKAFSIIDSIIVTPGPFSIFRTEHILALSPNASEVWQHAHGTEDFEMGLRLQSNFKKIANEPLAQVHTISPNTLYSLYRQRLRWVYGFLMNAYDYKHMIGNHKYGNVGMFILPTALLGVFGAVYMFGLLIFNILKGTFNLLERVLTTGMHVSWPNLELFYINTNAMLFIVISLLAILLLILHNSALLSGVKVHKRDTALYLLLYGFVSPLWLTSALARALIGAESKWRVIR